MLSENSKLLTRIRLCYLKDQNYLLEYDYAI